MTFNFNRGEYESLEQWGETGRRCATVPPSSLQRSRVMGELAATRRAKLRIGRLTIHVQFTHIVDGNLGRIDSATRDAQVEVLNDCYSPWDIEFTYDSARVRTVDHADWFRMGHRSAAERAAKTSLRVDPNYSLNFYTAGLQRGLLGWATWPYDLAGDPDMDGVVLLHSSLPGGASPPFDEGKTAVHEVGHWLGLYHTFQGGCTPPGDEVDDTPAHSDANYGKPAEGQPNGACVQGEEAPIHNYMNYVDDAWMTEFTSGQADRMKELIATYRPLLVHGPDAAPTD